VESNSKAAPTPEISIAYITVKAKETFAS